MLQTRRYTTWQLVRWPILFGGLLTSFVIMFRNRHSYFDEDIKKLRQKNWEKSRKTQEVMDKVKLDANMEIKRKQLGKANSS